MNDMTRIEGVVTAVLTPIDRQGKPDLGRLQRHIRQLERDGSNAILLMGTTGEGPSFSLAEREAVHASAIGAAGKMQVLAQTGCASLTDTIHLTRQAFAHGIRTVTILPPFFFKGVSDNGLFTYYSRILDEAIPSWGRLMLYHIPQVTQTPISIRLVEMLLNKENIRIEGIKDSSGSIEHLRDYCNIFPQLSILTGNDQLILESLKAGATGCVTGVANVFAAMAGDIVRAFSCGNPEAVELQRQLTAIWRVLDRYQPYTTLLKALLTLRYEDPGWISVRPPLDPMPHALFGEMIAELQRINLPEAYNWIQQANVSRSELKEST